MQFTIAITTLFVAIAAAAPSAAPAPMITGVMGRDVSAANALQVQAAAFVSAKEAAGCQKLNCFAALAPTVVSCAAALAEAGLNPIADAACLATLANSVINVPTVCDGCL